MNNKLLHNTFWFSFFCATQIFFISIFINLDKFLHILSIQLFSFSVYLCGYWVFNAFYIYLLKPKTEKQKYILLLGYFNINSTLLMLMFYKYFTIEIMIIIGVMSSFMIVNLNKIYNFILNHFKLMEY